MLRGFHFSSFLSMAPCTSPGSTRAPASSRNALGMVEGSLVKGRVKECWRPEREWLKKRKREGRRREGRSREEKEETSLEGKKEEEVVCRFTWILQSSFFPLHLLMRSPQSQLISLKESMRMRLSSDKQSNYEYSLESEYAFSTEKIPCPRESVFLNNNNSRTQSKQQPILIYFKW